MSAELPKMRQDFSDWWRSLPQDQRYDFDSEDRGYKKPPEVLMWAAWQEATRQAMEQIDHLQLLFNASKLGHEQAFASSQRAHSALSALQRDLNIMLASAVPEGGEWVEGYRIKTGALHRIVGTMQEAGYSVVLPALLPQSEKRHG